MRVIKANYTTGHDLPRPLLTQPDHASLNQLYVRFATCIDDLPVHLFPDNIALSSSHASSTSNKFATQITDIHVTYLTLKMHLVEKLEDTGYFSGESKDMLVLRKTEIAREMVRLLQNLPLWALKMNGEPCVSMLSLLTLERKLIYDSMYLGREDSPCWSKLNCYNSRWFTFRSPGPT